MYYLILPITNIPAPHSQNHPVAPLQAFDAIDELALEQTIGFKTK